MAKRVDKKEHPVRKLVSLFIVIALIYGWVSFGIAQLHWTEIQSAASGFWNQLTGNTAQTTDEPSAFPSASDATGEDGVTASPEATPEISEGDKESDKATDAKTNESADSKSDAKTDAKKEEPKKHDAVSFIPKFALDLAGGTEIILTPQLENGQTVDQNALDQAISVIRQRIDASGVAEAEINQQGNSNIVVGIPGEKPSDETIKLISNAAKMNFRPVIVSGGATSTFYMSALQTESAINSISSEGLEKGEDGQPTQDAIQKALTEANAKDASTFQSQKVSSDTATGTSKFADVPQDKIQEFDALDCSNEDNRKGGSKDDPTQYIATCSQDGSAKYMLAPVAVPGDGIAKANSGLKPLQNGKYSNEWIVQLEFKPEADDQFINISKQIKVLESPRNQFAICLDGLVISSPQIQKDTEFQKGSGVEISSGQGTDAAGGGQEWANTLANQLSFGALPMSFNVDSTEQVSATLGSESLEKGLLAGLIGLLLVVLYSLFQYRALGLITIGSLAIASALTYGSVLLLSWQMGYRLSLPGIIGFIVSIGITADSFIVYFERIRDELRDGRALDFAVSRGWKRALRTITASDFVNVLAAFILYFLAVGGVRGFAFTLGLTTVIDFIVVCMFTHPVVSLLARRRFFWAGHPASGLSAFSLGTKSAERYRKLSREEKKDIAREAKEKKLLLKEQKKALKLSTKSARLTKRDAKKTARLHAKQYDLEMKTRQKLLKKGMTEEEVFDAIPLGSGVGAVNARTNGAKTVPTSGQANDARTSGAKTARNGGGAGMTIAERKAAAEEEAKAANDAPTKGQANDAPTKGQAKTAPTKGQAKSTRTNGSAGKTSVKSVSKKPAAKKVSK